MSNLIDLLPERYKNGTEIPVYEVAFQTITDLAKEQIDELFLQLNVETATWGLELWEKQYGITTDAAKSYTTRRSRIISKMRGVGTTTVELIKNVSESFVNGEVAVTENNGEYSFTVTMVSRVGIPSNMEDLKAAIEEVKPAHLAIVWAYKYHLWGDVLNKTWGDIKDKTWGYMLEGDWT